LHSWICAPSAWIVAIKVSPGADMASGNSVAASAAAANVAPAAITEMTVRGLRIAQNGLRRDAAASTGLLNIRLFPSICVSEALKPRLLYR
jgi:hypothetical protein